MRSRWLLAAAAACLAGLGVRVFVLSRDLTEADRDLVETTAYVAQMSSELTTTRADADLLVEMFAVLRADGLRQIDLRGPSVGRGRAFVSARGLVLLVEGLPAPGTGRTYQAWVGSPDATPVSAGTFDVNPFGMGTVVWTRPASPGPVPVVSVTAEPPGGSSAPTSRPVLVGSWRGQPPSPAFP